jgi:cytochrome P450
VPSAAAAAAVAAAAAQITENFAYLPFGGGRRKCIGDQFALFETLVALAMLVRRYTFELAPGKPEVGMTTGRLVLLCWKLSPRGGCRGHGWGAGQALQL